MKRYGILSVGLILTALTLALAGCDDFMGTKDDADFANTNANLGTLKVDDKSVSFGYPNITAEEAEPLQTPVQVAETFTVSATPETAGATVKWVVTPASAPDYATLTFDTEDAFAQPTGNYFLIIQVTSQDGLVVWYYKVTLSVGDPPEFTTDLTPADNFTGLVGATIPPLTVAATAADAITYQWYRAATANGVGTPIANETGTSYTPPNAPAGTVYYYVVVTRTLNGATATSSRATVTLTVPANPAIPVFSLEPISEDYVFGDTIELEVLAAAPNGASINYQWFSADAPTGGMSNQLSGETNTVYNPGILPVGTYYFYAVATNATNQSYKTDSARATITVAARVNAATPVFGTEPLSAFYAGESVAALTVSATIGDGGSGGNLTFAWFAASNPGSPIATGPTYTPTLSAGNTEYYYVVATNTNNTVNGTKVVTEESGRAKITVMNFSPESNPAPVSVDNAELFRIDLGADFDITEYTHFTIGLNVTTNGTTAITPVDWDGIAVMQWQYWDSAGLPPGYERSAKQITPPLDLGGGDSLPDQKWRWDLLNIGPGEAANTNAAIPAYMAFIDVQNQGILDAPNQEDIGLLGIGNPGSYEIHNPRYLYFTTGGDWSGSGAQYLGVTSIKFWKQ